MPVFTHTLRPMADTDPLASFRAELRRHREELGLNYRQAAGRAEITGARWSSIERGWEIKTGGVRIEANPHRNTMIKMARAVGWPVDEALALAGKPPLTAAETNWTSHDHREELRQLTESLSDAQVRALLYVGRLYVDAASLIPDVEQSGSTAVDRLPHGGSAGSESDHGRSATRS